MQRLILTLDTPAENLALDEALLDTAETEGGDAEYLRVWESPRPMVVLGRSSRVDEEVDRGVCAKCCLPNLRRSSGGATIVAGPGCLMYAVVLSYELRPALRGIHESHRFVLDTLAASLAMRVPSVVRAGTSDLAFVDESLRDDDKSLRKFSGNSMRAKRTHLLYHGTLLYDFDLALVAACLRTAPRQPAYRESRDHGDFIANLPLARDEVEAAIRSAWPTKSELQNWPRARVDELVAARYGQDDWNLGYGQNSSGA